MRFYVTSVHEAQRDHVTGDVLYSRFWGSFLKRLCQLVESAGVHQRDNTREESTVVHRFSIQADGWPTAMHRALTAIDSAAVGAHAGGDIRLDYPNGLKLVSVTIDTVLPDE